MHLDMIAILKRQIFGNWRQGRPICLRNGHLHYTRRSDHIDPSHWVPQLDPVLTHQAAYAKRKTLYAECAIFSIQPEAGVRPVAVFAQVDRWPELPQPGRDLAVRVAH
jgi:hypothetical protein